MTFSNRQQSGNILLVMLVTAALVVVPLLLFLSRFGLYNVDRERVQNVVEAASLVAANDISRIIINDPHFGYVSLSNYPARGRGACTLYGEPVPVIGVNTLVGTIRQNTIVAHELNNDTMKSLAEFDRAQLQLTIKELNKTVSDSLKQRPKDQYLDVDGSKVEPYKRVIAFLKSNLPAGVQLESVQLTNGWLDGGSTSATVAPRPLRLAQLKPADSISGQYRAFVNVPAGGEPFSLAGIGPTTSLVRTASFRKADATHINSIVKLDCVISKKHAAATSTTGKQETLKMSASACSQPFSMDDSSASGIMTLRFTGFPAAGLRSWSDLLDRHTFRDHSVNSYRAMHGDYPVDSGSRLVALDADEDSGTAQQFSEHLYYWLRNGHVRPSLDAVLAMVNERFYGSPGETISYEFSRDGTISRTIMSMNNSIPRSVIADEQCQTICDTSTQCNNPIVVIRDNVTTLGTTSGGKHAGQPLKGLAVDIEIGGTQPSTAMVDLTRMRALKR